MDLQKILGLTIIAWAVGMICFTMYCQPFKNFMDQLFVFVVLAVALFAFFYKPPQGPAPKGRRAAEHFDQLGSALTAVTQNQGEDISAFSTGLTVYYSAFSASSYSGSGKTWYNISPFFSKGIGAGACPDVPVTKTHAAFYEVPSFSTATGFALGRNFLVGPQSYQMGMAFNGSFTIALAIQFDAFSVAPPAANLEFLKLYANTVGNNGLNLYMKPNYQQNGASGVYAVEVYAGFGDDAPVRIAGLTTINTAYVYLFVVSKSGLNLSLTIFSDVANLSSTASTNFVTKLPIVAATDVSLSNKEMVINTNANLQAHVFSLAVWNMALGVAGMASVFANLQVQLQKQNPTVLSYANTIAYWQNQAAAANKCPYDDATCKACSGVTQWNNVSDLILNGGSKCLSLIDQYCTNNPTMNMCACWNTSSALSGTDQCKQYKAIYRGADKNNVDINAIDADSLRQIREKYNLCSCTGAGTPTAPSGPPPLTPLPQPPVPRLINSIYTINQSDIDLYNSLPVRGAADATAINTSIFQPLLALIGKD